MIKVFFESKICAEVAATFANNELYMICLPALKIQAKKENKILTEVEL